MCISPASLVYSNKNNLCVKIHTAKYKLYLFQFSLNNNNLYVFK